VSYKLVALFLWFFSTLLVWHRFRRQPHWQLTVLILVLLPPCILMWTVGGLETPLLLFLATLAVFLIGGTRPVSLSLLCVVFLLAALAFLTRFDSVLFFLPLLLYAASKARSASRVLIATIVAAILPIAWLGVSLLYYGDLLPTSFYVKTPNTSFGNIVYNGKYVVSFLFFVGVMPMIAFGFGLLQPRRRLLQVLYDHFKNTWWLYLGLLLELAYGLTMATHHMMFSFRFFVPYLPATALIVVDFVRRASETNAAALSSNKAAALLAGFLCCLTLFQLYQMVYSYVRSVNGLSLFGEYRSLGVRDYEHFMGILRQEAVDIEEHWNRLAIGQDRRPRIITYAAGILPYTFRGAYIYEKLISYRHCFQRRDQALHADYVHIVAPRLGTVEQQLPKPEASYSLISAYDMYFDGSQQRFLVYYNPAPEAHNLSSQIAAPCHGVEMGMP
jgi:hypothetical protein